VCKDFIEFNTLKAANIYRNEMSTEMSTHKSTEFDAHWTVHRCDN